jgi:hypothetical protein
MGLRVPRYRVGPVAEHHASCAKSTQPIEQIFKAWPESRTNAPTEAAGEDQNVEGGETAGSKSDRVGAHGPPGAMAGGLGLLSGLAGPISSMIFRRNLCRVMSSICRRVSQPNLCVTMSR